MARMNPEQVEPSFSPASALALSNMEEGMGHNAERAQASQDELAQRRASLHHDSAEAQALQGKEALLADIIEEEMAHWTWVLVLSHLHLQQAEEIKSASWWDKVFIHSVGKTTSYLGESPRAAEQDAWKACSSHGIGLKSYKGRHSMYYLVQLMPEEVQQ